MSAQRNVLWITLDSVRADHTSLHGHDRQTTPNLERLANRPDAQRFSQCLSHGVWTRPSTTSIFTGTPPSQHNVVTFDSALDDRFDTAAELFARQGYHTACLSRNPNLSSATNLDRGFEDFAWLAASTLLEHAGPQTLLKYLLNIRRHSAGLTTDTNRHSTAFLMNDIAKRWLDRFETSHEPFFFYLHYNQPHRPYYPPRSHLDHFDDYDLSTREALEFAMDLDADVFETVATAESVTDEQWEALAALYDAGIAYTDACIGRLLEYVRDLDLGETTIVVTGDHGELLGEDGLVGHRYVVDDAVVHVPCVVSGLPEIDHQADSLVQHGDLMRTLLELAGAPTDQFRGVDLRAASRSYAFSQRSGAHARRGLASIREHDPSFDHDRVDPSTLTGIRTEEFKYCESEETAALYRLSDEGTDVSETHPTVRSGLETELAAWLEDVDSPSPAVGGSDLSPAVESSLRDMGYL